ncbi:MAG: histidine--tRNA ligase [Mycoplasmoidaceae bacterium]
MLYKKPRGTQDLFFLNQDNFNWLVNICKQTAINWNYNQITTPTFEDINIYYSKNENSNLVRKELFEFYDKSNRHFCLRPEGTAGTMRAIIENKLLLTETMPLKLFYISNFFRYERPQSGRLREFHQFGIEKVGITSIYEQFEIILFLNQLINKINLKNYTFKINYIGNSHTMNKWINCLREYFFQHKESLSVDSVKRLEKNPLRILDDKIDSFKDFVVNAPRIDSFLEKEEELQIIQIKKFLDENKIKYVFDKNLVRGLDYYCGFVFEVVSNCKALIGQSTIIGGGVYNNIISRFSDGKDYLSFGFGLGIERLLVALNEQEFIFPKKKIDIYLAPLSIVCINKFFELENDLSRDGYIIGGLLNTFKIKNHFKEAKKNNASIIIIFGEKELSNNFLKIKDQKTLEEKEIENINLNNYLKEFFKNSI